MSTPSLTGLLWARPSRHLWSDQTQRTGRFQLMSLTLRLHDIYAQRLIAPSHPKG